MKNSFDVAYRAARSRYESARLSRGFARALAAVLVVGALASAVIGARALLWLPFSLAALTFTEWRGTFWSQGARRGIVAGLAAMLLPLSILRPCCAPGGAMMGGETMGASCCTMPSACWAVGAAVGLAMSLLLPKAPEGRRTEAALGMILGTTAVAITRCSMLFLGESLGLLGGIAAAIAAGSVARVWMGRARSAM